MVSRCFTNPLSARVGGEILERALKNKPTCGSKYPNLKG